MTHTTAMFFSIVVAMSLSPLGFLARDFGGGSRAERLIEVIFGVIIVVLNFEWTHGHGVGSCIRQRS